MSEFFLYGTLLDRDLLQIVLGADPDGRLTPAQWPGWQAYWAQEGLYPIPAPAPEGQAEGFVLTDVTPIERARMHFYEAAFYYLPKPIEVVTEAGPRQVQVYVPDRDIGTPGAPWSITEWQDKRGAMSREAARDVMSRFGKMTQEEFRSSIGMRRARAASRISASQDPTPRVLGNSRRRNEVHVTRAWQPYSDFFAIESRILNHPTYTGGRSEDLRRSVFIGTDAVIVLPYDPVADRVLLVEQFRCGPFVRGDIHPWTIEAVAGNIDPGETPEEAAHREVREEAGLALQSLISVSRAYASTGNSSDFFNSYVGLCDLSDVVSGFYGQEDEGEDIRTLILDYAEFQDFLASPEANVVPLLQIGFWLQANRARLRGQAG